jgi:hypothetical protein
MLNWVCCAGMDPARRDKLSARCVGSVMLAHRQGGESGEEGCKAEDEGSRR